jgi:hypothetical protein
MPFIHFTYNIIEDYVRKTMGQNSMSDVITMGITPSTRDEVTFITVTDRYSFGDEIMHCWDKPYNVSQHIVHYQGKPSIDAEKEDLFTFDEAFITADKT